MEQLQTFVESDEHLVLVAELDDIYGSFGRIGLALVEKDGPIWLLRLFLTSCRVMSRGVGAMLLGYIMTLAAEHGVKLRAEYLPNDRNRMMLVTLRFAGFHMIDSEAGLQILEADLSKAPPSPTYVRLESRV